VSPVALQERATTCIDHRDWRRAGWLLSPCEMSRKNITGRVRVGVSVSLVQFRQYTGARLG
jgi:hypothetical protein